MTKDVINPDHYKNHPSGIECIEVVEHMPANIANAMKYLWRCDAKHDDPTEDLEKAVWYTKREIQRRKALKAKFNSDWSSEKLTGA